MGPLKVAGMRCGHCVATVSKAVQTLPGVQTVSVDLGRGEVTVVGNADEQAVRQAITRAGYEVQAAA